MKSQESEHKRIIVPILPTLLWIKNSKKNSNKIKKIKKHHSSFISIQIGLGKAKKVSKKKIIVPILPTLPRIENSKKNSKKLKTHHSSFISSQIGLGKAEKVSKKNNYRSDPSDPIQNREFWKKIAKKFKKI